MIPEYLIILRLKTLSDNDLLSSIRGMQELLEYYEGASNVKAAASCPLCASFGRDENCYGCPWIIMTGVDCGDYAGNLGFESCLGDLRAARAKEWIGIRVPQLKEWIEIYKDLESLR